MAEYSGDEVSTICRQILKRVEGELNDADFECFNKMVKPPESGCRQCEGTGCFFDGTGITVCRRCDYHRSKGRVLSITEPGSVSQDRSKRR